MSDVKTKAQFSFVFKDEPRTKVGTVVVLKDRRAAEHSASVQRRLLDSGVFSIRDEAKRQR